VRQREGVTAERSGIEGLLEHATWLRGLASALVRDPASADDLVQDTWVAAMRNPRPSGVAPRAWLTGIARNLARLHFRGAARRERRERHVGAAAPLPGADVLAERLDTQRRLAAYVAELPEPLRSTVLLRYYEGLDCAEIARRRGEPAGTVRWRLAQALEHLRRRLDDAHGGRRSAWLALLAPLPGPPTQAPPRAPSRVTVPLAGFGGLFMASMSKLVAAGVAVLLLTAGVAFLATRDADPVPRSETLAHSAQDAAAPPETPASTARPAVRRVQPDASKPPESVAAPGAPGREDKAFALVAGRVVDLGRRPLAGATVRVGREGKDHQAGEDGRFALDVPVADPTAEETVVFLAPGRAVRAFKWTLVRGSTTDVGDVLLAEGGTVSGHVFDDRNVPVPAASLTLVGIPVEDGASCGAPPEIRTPSPDMLLGPEMLSLALVEAINEGPDFATDEKGAFTLTGLPVGVETRVRIASSGTRRRIQQVTARAEVPLTGLRWVVERLRDDEGIDGVVTAPDGAPAAGAHLEVEFRGKYMASVLDAVCDQLGRFHVDTMKETSYRIRVADATHAWISQSVGPLAPGSHDVKITASAARMLEVVALAPDGSRVPTFRYQVEPGGDVLPGSSSNEKEAGPDAPARGLLPAGAFTVVVTAPGFETARIENLDPKTSGERVEVRLTQAVMMRGLVRAAEGPVAGATVTLHRAAIGATIYAAGFKLSREPSPVATATTDAKGVYELTIRDRSTYILRAAADGFAGGETPKVELAPGQPGEFPPILVMRGGAIEGTVRTGGARSPDGLYVAASRGDGDVRSQRIGPDGRYRFEKLAPGPWFVRVMESALPDDRTVIAVVDGNEGHPPDSNCEIRSGETTRKDLGYGTASASVVRGRLTAPGDRKWYVGLYYADFVRGMTDDKIASVAADGTFEFCTDRTGDYLLAFATEHYETQYFVPVRLGGETRCDRTLSGGTVKVAVPETRRGDMRKVIWLGESGAFCFAEAEVREDGALVAPNVPAGRVRIASADPDTADSDPRKWHVDAEIDVAAGRTAVVELR
jgi:RNA polymerase sigma-70 factor, ECF subfamily